MYDEHLLSKIGVFPTGPVLETDELVGTVLELDPRRILELGVGNGYLLFQLAPYCHVYRGLDARPALVDLVRDQVKFRRGLLEPVSVVVQGPDDFFGIERDFFDVVLLHSPVYQSRTCLEQGLRGAQRSLAGGGALFIQKSEEDGDWVELIQGELITVT